MSSACHYHKAIFPLISSDCSEEPSSLGGLRAHEEQTVKRHTQSLLLAYTVSVLHSLSLSHTLSVILSLCHSLCSPPWLLVSLWSWSREVDFVLRTEAFKHFILHLPPLLPRVSSLFLSDSFCQSLIVSLFQFNSHLVFTLSDRHTQMH